jgi:hypothetical protein
VFTAERRSGKRMRVRIATALLIVVLALSGTPARAAAGDDDYGLEEIVDAAVAFFGATSEGVAKVVEKVVADLGRPNAYITGEEVSGAIGVGLRYGKGTLNRKVAAPRPVFWQGPSIGWDVGGNAAKAFILVYNLDQTGELILAPIRTGVGWRAGANIGYLHFTREHSWIPF